MTINCWVCESGSLIRAKPANVKSTLKSKDFAITDNQYGITGNLYQCQQCGFLQCADFDDVLPYYETLQDPAYEAGRKARAIQARKILDLVRQYCPDGRLLDIGAGSGILVEQALNVGYTAEGLEPSKWLQEKAQLAHGLPVYLGTLPHPKLTELYNIVTMIDVIEHIPQPVPLLSQISKMLAKDGILVVVTPDVSSVMARLLGWKWWHFRIAHVGYFNKNTLNLAAEKAGFELIRLFRPGWYVTVDYLLERIASYLWKPFNISKFTALKKLTVPLNFYDSMLCIFALRRDYHDG